MRKLIQLVSLVLIGVSVTVGGQTIAQADTATNTSETLATADRQTVAVYPDAGPVHMYDANGNQLPDVVLADNTNLATQGTVIIKGTKYYRISNDNLIKASDVYVYKMSLLQVQTKKAKIATLVDAHGKTITNRAVAGTTTWKIDRVIQIDNKNYYRVATNEFIPSDNVSVVK